MNTQKAALHVVQDQNGNHFCGAQSYMAGVSDIEHTESSRLAQKQEREIGEIKEKLLLLINELEELLDEND